MQISWEPLRSDPEPQRLLFLAPHVGGGAAVGRDLARSLPDGWAVYGLVLPGRERLIAEPVEWEFDAAATVAADALEEVAARHPAAEVVGLGQCSGAWLMYAILARAASRPGSRARLMVAVSQGAWHLPRVHPDLPESSETLWAQLVASGDAQPAVAEDEDARDLLEPVIRADYTAVAGFPYAADPLKIPLLVVAGSEDRDIDRSVAQSWADYCTRLDFEEVSGGHYLLQENPAAVARAVVERADLTS
ncbi:thioesterase II family protein [Catellatospora bangladeshensis]|uniref:Pyochelin biosynthetic protein PchC n=1 Tax=Catellatospora bangladeshensis TaxID=310355 RepID=A0A8J3JZ16_9ACTN|nr:alpha/beta fold hydrolase [Catellatospora bangladeshensis]GIF85599.1 pyochelin biosynthetic protein PchC [Catellatospora bangladeshensis]